MKMYLFFNELAKKAMQKFVFGLLERILHSNQETIGWSVTVNYLGHYDLIT